MYDKPVLLNSITHKSLRVAPVKQHAFAKGMNSIVVLAQEFSEAAKQYPVIFTNSPPDELKPMVIVGFKDNLFINDTGTWDSGYYVPAFMRRYPYILAENDTSDGTLSVCIDSDYEGFDVSGGDRLFTDDGDNSPELDQAIEFLRLFQGQYEITRSFVKHLEKLNLFKAVDATIALEGGEKFVMGGLSMVDEEAFQKLPDSEVLTLVRLGYLPWIYAHLFSLTNFKTLLGRMGNVVLQKED